MMDLKCILNETEKKQWILYEEHVADYLDYEPLCVRSDGIRFHVLYKNTNKQSKFFNKYFCMTIFISGDNVDFEELSDAEAENKYNWIIG